MMKALAMSTLVTVILCVGALAGATMFGIEAVALGIFAAIVAAVALN